MTFNFPEPVSYEEGESIQRLIDRIPKPKKEYAEDLVENIDKLLKEDIEKLFVKIKFLMEIEDEFR